MCSSDLGKPRNDGGTVGMRTVHARRSSARTWSMAFENRRAGDYVIDKPEEYDYFVKKIMPYDRYPVFSMYGPDSSTGKAKRFGMFNGETDADGNKLFGLFTYRRIVNSAYFKDGFAPYDVTMLNWPQNDYFFGNTFDEDRKSTRLNSSHANESRMPSSA